MRASQAQQRWLCFRPKRKHEDANIPPKEWRWAECDALGANFQYQRGPPRTFLRQSVVHRHVHLTGPTRDLLPALQREEDHQSIGPWFQPASRRLFAQDLPHSPMQRKKSRQSQLLQQKAGWKRLDSKSSESLRNVWGNSRISSVLLNVKSGRKIIDFLNEIEID